MKIQKMVGWVAILSLVIVFGAFAKASPNVDVSQLDAKDQKLVQQLDNEKTDKRMQAAQKLADRNCVQAEDALLNMLQKDPAYQARIVAAMSLIKLDSEKALDAIKDQAEKDPNQIARNALNGMVKQIQNNS